MNQAVNPDMQAPSVQSIVVDEIFPHAPAVVWKALTSGELMGRWLMVPTGFEPRVGCTFTFRTKPAGDWDGTIHCESAGGHSERAVVACVEGRARPMTATARN